MKLIETKTKGWYLLHNKSSKKDVIIDRGQAVSDQKLTQSEVEFLKHIYQSWK